MGIKNLKWQMSSQKEMLRFDHSSIKENETNEQIQGINYEANSLLRFFRFFIKCKSWLSGDEMKKTHVKVDLLKTNWIFRGTKTKVTTDFDDLLSIFGQNVNDSI